MSKPVRDDELQDAFRYLRKRKRYADLMPPPRTLKVDWFLMRAILAEIERRRKPGIRLQVLTGSVVREFIPDESPGTRRLGMAYRDGIMKVFSLRAHRQKRQKAKVPSTQNPADEKGQYRLI